MKKKEEWPTRTYSSRSSASRPPAPVEDAGARDSSSLVTSKGNTLVNVVWHEHKLQLAWYMTLGVVLSLAT